MVDTPSWQAASTNYAGNAVHVNQFLGTHTSEFIYSGTIQDSQSTGNSVYSSTQGNYLAQTFTTATNQTAVGSLQLQVSTIGGSPTSELISPLVVGIYATAGNTPTGSPLAYTEILSLYVYSSPFWVTVPLPVVGLTGGTKYAIVTGSVGTSSHYYVWQHSNQVSGASTSTNSGVSWTANNYGFMYRVSDNSVGSGSSLPIFVYDDNGNRWTKFSYNSNGTLATVSGRTLAQNGTFLTFSSTLTYTNGLVTGVS